MRIKILNVNIWLMLLKIFKFTTRIFEKNEFDKIDNKFCINDKKNSKNLSKNCFLSENQID